MPSATVQTTVRQLLLMAGAPATTIAIAGSQYSVKTSHRLDRMSRDSQVVASDFIPRTAASARSKQFYNLECSPESSEIAGGSRATRKLATSPISVSGLRTTRALTNVSSQLTLRREASAVCAESLAMRRK